MKRRALSVFRRSQCGSTAVEFAIVAPVFLALIFSIMEAGWFFFVNSAVQEANAAASRFVRTGQAQQNNVAPDEFFKRICSVVDNFGDCDKDLTIDISRYDDFGALASDLSQPQCREADASVAGAQFKAADYGAERDVIRIRTCFLYQPINPALGLNLAQTADGRRKIVSVSIFRNEPFGARQ